MKGVVNCYLNVRSGEPSVNAPNPFYLVPGDKVEVDEIVTGDVIDGKDVWYKLMDGNFVSSAGIDLDSDNRLIKDKIAWHIEEYALPRFWERYSRGENVTIAVLDSGIDITHPEFQDRVFANLSKDFTSANSIADEIGHGTHVSGIISSNNQSKITSIAPKSKLIVGKISRTGRDILQAQLADAIRWAADIQEVDIINLSLYVQSDSKDQIKSAVDYALGKNKVVVAANGNFNGFATVPGRIDPVIQVGSVSQDKALQFKEDSDFPFTICSPGVKIFSTFINGSYKEDGGTSMASAFTSGMLALKISKLKESNSNLDLIHKKLSDEMVKTAININTANQRFSIINPNEFFE